MPTLAAPPVEAQRILCYKLKHNTKRYIVKRNLRKFSWSGRLWLIETATVAYKSGPQTLISALVRWGYACLLQKLGT
jgi:hypothetical protein